MSFFSNASGVNVFGGIFYATAGDVNIQNDQQLALQQNTTQALISVGSLPAPPLDYSQEGIEDDSVSEPDPNRGYSGELGRFVRRGYGSLDLSTGGLRSPGWGRAAQLPPSPDVFAHLYLPSSHRRPEPARTRLILEPPSDAPDVDPPGTLSMASGTTINASPASNMDRPPGTNIHGGTFVAGNMSMNNIQRNGESGIGILHRAVALAALHDAAESYPQPRCHPETRQKILEDLWTWCTHSSTSREESDDGSSSTSGEGSADDSSDELDGDDSAEDFDEDREESDDGLSSTSGEGSADDSSGELAGDDSAEDFDEDTPILWLHGPAGAGKSAVMKILSERLQGSQRLGATFFFKRGHPTRGNAHVLFATIALQLAINVPALNQPISRVVEADPTLVGRSMDVQLRELIVEPCSTIECGLTRVILIDGLDECDGKHIQQEILRLIRDSAVSETPLPFRIIIASRPEPHIREVFEGLLFDLHRPVNIEQSFDDVRAYLQSEFARIHREHSTMAAVPNPWPSPEVIEFLVEKSSGYFIYASTVIKFIDDKNYRPTRRLAELEDTPATHSHSPFAALDALYTQILSEIADNPDLVPILRVISYFSLRARKIDELLGLESGDVDLALRGLHSVIDEADSGLAFIHASFGDFLNDPSRAGDFYIGDAPGLEDLARRLLSEYLPQQAPSCVLDINPP